MKLECEREMWYTEKSGFYIRRVYEKLVLSATFDCQLCDNRFTDADMCTVRERMNKRGIRALAEMPVKLICTECYIRNQNKYYLVGTPPPAIYLIAKALDIPLKHI